MILIMHSTMESTSSMLKMAGAKAHLRLLSVSCSMDSIGKRKNPWKKENVYRKLHGNLESMAEALYLKHMEKHIV